MWYGVYKEATKTKLDENTILEIGLLYENGTSSREIIKRYHITYPRLMKILESLGIEPRKISSDQIRREQLNQNIRQDTLDGYKPLEIANRYNIAVETVLRTLELLGIEPVKTRSRLDRDIRVEIIRLFNEHVSPFEIAKRFGIHVKDIYRVLDAYGVPRPTRFERKDPMTEDELIEALGRYEAGEAMLPISEEMEISYPELRRELAHRGMLRGRKSHTFYTPEQQMEIVRRFNSGQRSVQIAKEMNLWRNTVKSFLDWQQLVHPEWDGRIPMDMYYRKFGDVEIQEIRRMRDEGLSFSEIARKMNASGAGIRDALDRSQAPSPVDDSQVPVQASFNLRRLLQASYSNEIGYLNRYLKEGFDPNDYEFELKTYLENQGQEFDEDLEYYEIAQEWLGKASKEDLEKFKNWVQNRPPSDMTDSPAYEAMSYNSFVKPTWLVHFTDDPYSIAKEGFQYGHDSTNGLALTTWYTEKARKSVAGYNFAFKVGSRDARICARQNKYGKHAVVFWGAGVEAWHSGDEEDQIIIWGPSVNTNLIFPVLNEEGSWVVNDWRNDKLLIKDDDFDKVSSWVVNNNRMLQQIRNKKT